MVIALLQSGVFISALAIGRVDRYNPRYHFDRVDNSQLNVRKERPVGNTFDQRAQNSTGEAAAYTRINGPPIAPPSYAGTQPVQSQPQAFAYQPYENEETYIPEDLPYDPKFSTTSNESK
mmetsp:Transcript_19574/g.22777  ORF Transcript_19574/g.22777 Transcript_19574/m.22777 type:complete len:120 (-) Transcript_19574:121-480(-)